MHILNDMECFKDFPIGKCVLRTSKSILNSMRSDFSYQYYFIDFSLKENSDKNPCRVYINLNCNVTYQLKLTTMNFLLTNQSQSWIQNLTFLLIRKLQNQICGKN